MRPPPQEVVEPNVIGRLMDLEKREFGYVGTIHFRYYRKLMGRIREGSFVAVENYLSEEESRRYTLLHVTEVFPKHFALDSVLGATRSPHPAFTWPAAESASKDWLSQVDDSEMPETFIECKAIPVGIDLKVGRQGRPDFDKVKNKPIQGIDAFLLNAKTVQELYNRGLVETKKIAEVGELVVDTTSGLDILADFERLIRLHFGVFATTGGGKSNLIATLTRRILSQLEDIKIVIFDIAGDYPALLMDQLVQNKSLILFADLPDFTRDEEQLTRRITFPVDLEEYRERCASHVGRLLKKKRIRLVLDTPSLNDIKKDFLQATRRFTTTKKTQAIDIVVREIDLLAATKPYVRDALEAAYEVRNKVDPKIPSGAEEILERLDDVCKTREEKVTRILDEYDVSELISDEELPKIITSDKYDERLIIISCPEVGRMRELLTDIAFKCLMRRKTSPTISPLVLFFFDEAHEFIPLETGGSAELGRSSRAVEALVRQGRKYGLGVCISSQRSRYLNTSVIAMLHTYFMGALPMPSDRERLSEAFNVEETVISQTVDFPPGQWILSSMVATGMKNVPITVRTENTEDAVRSFLEGKERITVEPFLHRVRLATAGRRSKRRSVSKKAEEFGTGKRRKRGTPRKKKRGRTVRGK